MTHSSLAFIWRFTVHSLASISSIYRGAALADAPPSYYKTWSRVVAFSTIRALSMAADVMLMMLAGIRCSFSPLNEMEKIGESEMICCWAAAVHFLVRYSNTNDLYRRNAPRSIPSSPFLRHPFSNVSVLLCFPPQNNSYKRSIWNGKQSLW